MKIAVKRRQFALVNAFPFSSFACMDCKANIEKNALTKLNDAELLFTHGRFDTAYYIAGYTVELLLKAKICETLGINSFFDFDNPERKKFVKDETSLKKAYKIHQYDQLLVLSGIHTEFNSELESNSDFLEMWPFVKQWNEGTRYSTSKSDNDVLVFITSIKEFYQWIQKYL